MPDIFSSDLYTDPVDTPVSTPTPTAINPDVPATGGLRRSTMGVDAGSTNGYVPIEAILNRASTGPQGSRNGMSYDIFGTGDQNSNTTPSVAPTTLPTTTPAATTPVQNQYGMQTLAQMFPNLNWAAIDSIAGGGNPAARQQLFEALQAQLGGGINPGFDPRLNYGYDPVSNTFGNEGMDSFKGYTPEQQAIVDKYTQYRQQGLTPTYFPSGRGDYESFPTSISNLYYDPKYGFFQDQKTNPTIPAVKGQDTFMNFLDAAMPSLVSAAFLGPTGVYSGIGNALGFSGPTASAIGRVPFTALNQAYTGQFNPLSYLTTVTPSIFGDAAKYANYGLNALGSFGRAQNQNNMLQNRFRTSQNAPSSNVFGS